MQLKKSILLYFCIFFTTQVISQIPKDSILNVTWILAETQNTFPIQRKVTFHIDMYHQEIKGFTGCNEFLLPISRVKNKKKYVEITTDEVVTTSNQCTKAVNFFEKELISSISNQKLKLKSEKDKIVLSINNEKRYIFSIHSQNPLLNTIQEYTWKLIELDGNDAQVYHPYLEFDFGTNTVRGYTGCNYFSGQVAVNTNLNKISFTNIKVKTCECNTSKRRKTEETFITLIENGTFSFDFTDKRLTLYKDNQSIMTLGLIPNQYLKIASN